MMFNEHRPGGMDFGDSAMDEEDEDLSSEQIVKMEEERKQQEEEWARRTTREAASREYRENRNQTMAENVKRIRALDIPESQMDRFYHRVHSDAIARHGKGDTFFLKLAIDEFERDPQTKRQYEEIILEGNYEALKDKTRKQLSKLHEFYISENSSVSKEAWEQRLEEFRRWAHALIPVRNDSDKTRTEYKSPKLTGNYEHSGVGGYDALVQAHDYVYATFDEIPHPMSGPVSGRVPLEVADIEHRAEIVMQDIADLATNTVDPIVRRYMDNIFDYQQGKEIIALYAASVFESPEEAADFFSRRAGDRFFAEKWDQGNYTESSDKSIRLREEQIVENMKRMLQLFNIEPPLSLEVRIKDSAKVKAG